MATERALAAVTAAKNRKKWGGYAAMRYATKRGVPLSMYATAVLVEMRRGFRAAA